MSTHRFHGVLFLDHHEARLHFPDAGEPEGGRIVMHRVKKTEDGHHHTLERRDLDAIASSLEGVQEILVMGPGSAKNELKTFIAEHYPEVDKHIVEVVPAERATPGELKDLARSKFRRLDLWL